MVRGAVEGSQMVAAGGGGDGAADSEARPVVSSGATPGQRLGEDGAEQRQNIAVVWGGYNDLLMGQVSYMFCVVLTL